MSTELITLLVIGAAFIIFGVFVLFLPEVRERGEKKALAKEEKDKKKKRGFFFWIFEPKLLPFTGSAIGVTAFVVTAVVLSAVPRTSPSSSANGGSSLTTSVVSSDESSTSTTSTGSSEGSSSTTSSGVVSSTPSSEAAGSIFTEGELPTWDLSEPTLNLATDIGFNHTIDYVNYLPVIHEKDYLVWGYERYENIPTSISDTFTQDWSAIRYSMIRFEIFNAFTGDLVFEYEFDPGVDYRTAYMNDANAQQFQESLSIAFDGENTILVNFSSVLTTAGSNGVVYEKAGDYQTMLDSIGNNVQDGRYSFLLKFELSNPSSYTVIDSFMTENDRSPVSYGQLLFMNGRYVMIGQAGSNINTNYAFVKTYLNNNFTLLEPNQEHLVSFTLTGTTLALTTFYAFPYGHSTRMRRYKDGLVYRMYDEEGKISLTSGKVLAYETTFQALENQIQASTFVGVETTYFDSLKVNLIAEIEPFQTLMETQFSTTFPNMYAWVNVEGFCDVELLPENEIQLTNTTYNFSLYHRDFSIGLFIARTLAVSKLNQPEGQRAITIETRTNELRLTNPNTIEEYYLSNESTVSSYYRFNEETEEKDIMFADLDPSIVLSEIIVHENGYYGSGFIREEDNFDAILISFDTNEVETARFVPEGSRTDIGSGFVTSPLGDPVWVITSFSTDGDYTPFALDLPEGSYQTYWVQFNRAS